MILYLYVIVALFLLQSKYVVVSQNSGSVLAELSRPTGIAEIVNPIVQPLRPTLSKIPNLDLIRVPIPILEFDPRIGGTAGNPGARIKISRKGLDYANDKAGQILNNLVRNLNIPDFRKNIDGGYVEAKDMSITGFNPPAYSYSISGSKLTWRANGAKISLKGRWKGRKKVVLITIKGSGTFTATASSVDISVGAKFTKSASGKPRLTDVSCSTKIGSLSLKIKGGIVGWLLNLFRGRIASRLKPLLQAEACKAAKRFILTDVNAKLNTLPVTVNLSPNFRLDYRLTRSPSLLSQKIFLADLKGEITYRGNNDPTPFYPHKLNSSDNTDDRMMCAWGSDFILNSFFHHAHENDLIRYTIRTGSLPGVSSYLAPTCKGTCFAKVDSGIPKRYSNARGEVVLKSTKAPTVVFTNGKARLNAKGQAILWLRTSQAPRPVHLLTVNVTGNALVDVRVNSARVSGEMSISNLNLKVVHSSLPGGLIPNLDDIEDLLIPLIELQVNNYLLRGLPIPLTQGITLRDTRSKILPRTFEVCSNVNYNP